MRKEVSDDVAEEDVPKVGSDADLPLPARERDGDFRASGKDPEKRRLREYTVSARQASDSNAKSWKALLPSGYALEASVVKSWRDEATDKLHAIISHPTFDIVPEGKRPPTEKINLSTGRSEADDRLDGRAPYPTVADTAAATGMSAKATVQEFPKLLGAELDRIQAASDAIKASGIGEVTPAMEGVKPSGDKSGQNKPR